MSKDSRGRKIIRVAISTKAKAVVEDFAEDNDMTEMGVASRLYEWFGKQPEDIQKWVLGLTTGGEARGMKEFAAALLKAIEIANTPTSPAPASIADPASPETATAIENNRTPLQPPSPVEIEPEMLNEPPES